MIEQNCDHHSPSIEVFHELGKNPSRQEQRENNQHTMHNAIDDAPVPRRAAYAYAPEGRVDNGKENSHRKVDRTTQSNSRLFIWSGSRA